MAAGPDFFSGWLMACLLLAVLALRLFYLRFCGLELAGDESYYWDWSRRLDWCYYSKPPMVAWLIALSTKLLGHTEFAVRLPAAVLGTGLAGCLYLAGRFFYNARAGILAALFILAAPADAALSLLMTIDPPLLFFWALALVFLGLALAKDGSRLGWWALAGAASGLALLSKQTAAAIPVMTGLALVVCLPWRKHIFRGYWLYGIIVAAAASPILHWNSQHDWITFQHTSAHFESGSWRFEKALGDFAGFAGAQAGLLSPLTFGLLMTASIRGLFSFFRLGSRERLLFLLGPLPLLGVIALSLCQRVLPNWPAPFYLSGLVLLSGWLSGGTSLGGGSQSFRPWIKPALTVGFFLAGLAYALPFLIKHYGFEGTKYDPAARLRRWKDTAARAEALRENLPAPERSFILVAASRQLASSLAFYLPDQPVIYRWEEKGGARSQYEIWPGPADRLGQDALVLCRRAPEDVPAELAAAFARWTFIEEIDIIIGPARRRHYYAYLGENLRRWPPRLLLQAGRARRLPEPEKLAGVAAGGGGEFHDAGLK